MNGNNESGNEASGNRWEAKPAEVVDQAGNAAASDVEAPLEVPVEAPAAAPAVPPTAPAEASNASKLPAWVTKRALVATGTAAAFFLGGGGIGYALGANGHDSGENRNFPARFDRDADGFGPGQPPGGGQGNFQAPQQQSQGQSQDGSGSDSGTSS